MLDYLISFVGRLGHWGYLVIFLIVALECQPLLGLVMPGESLVLVGGFFAGQGLLDPGVLIFVISIAAILGDSISYELGRYLGRGWLLKRGDVLGCARRTWTAWMDSSCGMAARPFSAVISYICCGR